MKYYIEKQQYFTAYGIGGKPYFKVYHINLFLGLIPYKKYAMNRIGRNSIIQLKFYTTDAAELFITDTLGKGIIPSAISSNIVKEVTVL